MSPLSSHNKASQMPTDQELSEEQILDLAEAAGKRLGVLISLAPYDDATKEALLALIEYATPVELIEFSRELEEGIVLSGGASFDKLILNAIKNIKQEEDGAREALNKETLTKLDFLWEKMNHTKKA